jgi:hypothetical protein
MGKRESNIRAQTRLALKPWHPVAVLFETKAGKAVLPGRRYPTTFLPNGWPDDTLLIRGRAVGVEIKSEKDRLQPDQASMARIWWIAGCPVIIVREGPDLIDRLTEVLPPEVLEPPTDQELALFREAHSAKWSERPKQWLRHRGFLPAGV